MHVQYSVHWPNKFIHTHLDLLLPSWLMPVASILVVLQKSECVLLDRTPETEAQKYQLREQFLKFGCTVVSRLCELGHWAEIFDPQTGWPVLSQPGQLKLDDVAVVQACLGYPLINKGGCLGIHHPEWGSAVYPSILVSSAHPEIVESVASDLSSISSSLQLET